MNSIYKFLFGSLLTLGAASIVCSCDDDKVYDMNHQEADVIGEITFDYTGELTLPIGKDVPLNPQAYPESAAKTGIIFKSSDESIAYIDNEGVLHCLKEGIANVSAVPTIGFGATAALTVNVVAQVNYTDKLSIVSVEPLDEYHYIGDTFQLATVHNPEDHTYNFIEWKSSNPSVLSVDQDGNVECLDEGVSTITALTKFPDAEGVAATLTITVSPAVDIEEIVLTPVSDPVCVSRPFNLEMTYSPEYGAIGSVTWESSNENVAYVNRGRVTPTGFGTCTITATCNNGNSSSVEIVVVPGWYIWDNANQWMPWGPGSNATFNRGAETLTVTMSAMDGTGAQYRGDIVLVNDNNNPVPFHFGEYPVVALRATIPADGRNTFDAVSADGINAGNPQCNEGRYATGNPITLSDGTKLIYVDFGARGTYSTDAYTYFTLFQLKVADIPAENVATDKIYKIYWIRTFKSVEEMQEFAEAEVAQGS